MVAILIKTQKHDIFCEDCDRSPYKENYDYGRSTIKKNGSFCEDCDHDRNPNKDSEIWHFYDDCDHDCSSSLILRGAFNSFSPRTLFLKNGGE